MSAHGDILDQPERLSGPFWGSVMLHVGFAATVLTFTYMHSGTRVQWGDIHGGGFGAVAVNTVHAIPLPTRSGPANPVANDTESRVPTPPPKAKAQPRVKEPPLDAIPLESRNAGKTHPERAYSAPNKWREQQQDRPNQLYSTAGQALTSAMYSITGGGGVGIGNNSPFGTQFGWYATILRDNIARNWQTAGIDPRLQTAPPVVVVFTMLHSGALVPGSVRVRQSSGNRELDLSAMRAIMDAAPFPAMPQQFTPDRANIELEFVLRR